MMKNAISFVYFLAVSTFLFVSVVSNASVKHDSKVPQVAFAAQELNKAMKESGKRKLSVTIKINIDETDPESFKIKIDKSNKVTITGTDANGAMYGGLELADMLKFGLPITDKEGRPFVEKRGIKFNIPWDARTPSYDDTGESAQKNIATMWDFDFWKEYLDDLARYRYNVLSLWSCHPFSNLVKLEDYPEAAMNDVYKVKDGIMQPDFRNRLQNLDKNGDLFIDLEHEGDILELVKEISIDEKIAFWQKVFNYAGDRGIEIVMFHWNVFTFGATGKHGITQDQTNPITVDYTRKAVYQMLKSYPQISTIGVLAGENADKVLKGEHQTENFLLKTFGQGIMDVQKEDPDRKVRLIVRRHATEQKKMTKAFKDGRYTGGIVDASVKYSVAHMYSSRRPQEWEKRIEDEDWLQNDYKVWLNLRNDDIFMHRWGSPNYVREFIKWMPHEHSPGFYMGSDGYVWAKEFISKHPENAGELEMKKHWYRFQLWGKLSYNNELGRDYWEAALKHRFPSVDAKLLYDAWETVSEVVPQLNRSVWAATDGDFAAEGVMERKGFLSLDKYNLKRPAMILNRIQDAPDAQCISANDWAQVQISGRKLKGLTPFEIANNLDAYAEVALKALEKLRTQQGDNLELRLTLDDIESMAYLGQYYADKMRAAAKLALFRLDKSQKKNNDEAIIHLENAVKDWAEYCRVLTPNYKTQLTARTSFLDWNATMEYVKKEVEDVRKEGDYPQISFMNINSGDHLANNSDLVVEVNAQDKDGIKDVCLYMNGLLLKQEQTEGKIFKWTAKSDDLLKTLNQGHYNLVAIARDNSGISSKIELGFTVGDGEVNNKQAWENKIHKEILKEGETMVVGDEIEFPRLQCKLRINEDGKMVLIDEREGLIFRTWSKDRPGPHFATLEHGQLKTYRGSPMKPKEVLWNSRELPDALTGPYKLGITVAKKLVVYKENEGQNAEILWTSR